MKPKERGRDQWSLTSIDEHNDYEHAKQADSSIKKYAREFLEYGENKEGYWTRDKFMVQIKQAINVAEMKERQMDSVMSGYSTTVVVTLPWLTMLWMLTR